MNFLDTWHDDRPMCALDACHILEDKIQDGRLMLVFVSKLDIFTNKSSLSVVRLPKFSELL